MSAVISQSEIERKRTELDFLNVWNQVANMEWHEFKAACEFCYLKGRIAGKSEGLRAAIAESYLGPMKEKV